MWPTLGCARAAPAQVWTCKTYSLAHLCYCDCLLQHVVCDMFAAGATGTVQPRRPRLPTDPRNHRGIRDVYERGRIAPHEIATFREDAEALEDRYRAKAKRRKKNDPYDLGARMSKRERQDIQDNDDALTRHYMSYDNVVRYVPCCSRPRPLHCGRA
jgi:hypothetical protein